MTRIVETSPRPLSPTVENLKRHAGIAGQFSVSADVQYPGEASAHIEFVGDVYGGPVVMCTRSGQIFVTAPDRFGNFGADPLTWVRRFFVTA